MAKLTTLAGSPGDFELTVKTKNLQGIDVEIPFTCIGRTLREWHPISLKRMAVDANSAIDAADKAEKPAGKKSDKPERVVLDEAKIQSGIDAGMKQMTDVIKEAASGWDLDDEFNDANLDTLCSKFPGIHQDLWRQYDARIRGDRLGN